MEQWRIGVLACWTLPRAAGIIRLLHHLEMEKSARCNHNSYFRQFLANVAQCKIVVPVSPDITAYGTGRLALIGSGLVPDPSDLAPPAKPQVILQIASRN